MAMYALAVVPVIRQLRAHVLEACQAWFADDATAVGPLSSFLFQWWQHRSSVGPDFRYFPNASKTVLIVKPEHLAAAEFIFAIVPTFRLLLRVKDILVQLWELVSLLRLMSHRKWQLGLLRLLLWRMLPLLGLMLLIVPSLMGLLVVGCM